MPTESVGRNYERNRENRTRRRRFRGGNVESVHEGLIKTPAGLRRSRIDMPTRSAKSLSNLTLIEKECGGNQGNNTGTGGGGGLMPISRFIKWYRNLSTTREPVPPTTPGRVVAVDQNPSSPPCQQSSHAGRKQGYMGPLGLGEYVDSMGGGFDEIDITSGSPQVQIKSRSLIDISMSNLWGEDEEIGPDGDADEAGRNGSWEKVQRPSISVERRPTLLAIVSRLLPLLSTPPNLLQFMDSPSTSVNIYENTEITFFGSSEDRWSTPAFVVTTCSRMQRGDLFNVHYVSDYLAELKLATDWVKGAKSLCEAELRKYKAAGKGKRSRRLISQGSALKGEYEVELKDLCADFTAFLEACDAFVAKTKDEFRGNPVSAILIAGHNERLVSLKNLLPITMPCASNETQKISAYRKFLCETSATATFNSFCQGQEGPIEVSAFLYNDCLLLASKCRLPKVSTASSTNSAKWNARSSGSTAVSSPPPPNRTPGVFETFARFPLTFLGVTTPISAASAAFSAGCELVGGGLIIKVTPPVLCSSSSGISSAASTEEEMEAGSENGSAASGCEDAVQALGLWWPPGNRCHLVFNEIRSFNEWRNCLQTSMEQVQSCFTNQTLQVKVLNGIAPEKCVHKYLPLSPSITARELKERALTAWNIAGQQVDAEVVISFVDPNRGSVELPLADEDKPFLLTLYVITLTGEKTTDEVIDLFATDQTDRSFTPRSLAFPLAIDRIPVTFNIRDSTNSTSSNSCIRPLPISMDHDLFEPLVHLMDRPKSINYHETSRTHRTPHLRGLSQSTHNLSASSVLVGASSGGGIGAGGKGRSRSRLRLCLSRNNMFSLGNDNEGDDKDSSPQQFGIFGRLPKEAWPDCRVSMSVMSLFVVIFYKGSLTEGIFRRSVQMSHLQALVHRVDTNEDPLMSGECSPLHAANILKKYFKEIPGHLLIDEKWDDWCKMTTLKTDEEIANYAKKMMRELPDINQSLLTFLLFTLAQVRVNQDTNKMSVDALSTVWGPNLLERPNAAPSLEDSAMCVAVVACLLGPFTDAYCLRSPEFRQKLSVFFDEIWGQMMPPGEMASKPPPEGISILELPEQKPDEITASNGGSGSPRSVEPLQAKDKRNGWMIRSSSAEESSEMANGLKRWSRALKKDRKSFSGQEGADLPPPIPPRYRHKSTSGCAFPPVSSPAASSITSAMEMDSPPPLPARTYGPFQGTCHAQNEQRRKVGVVARDILSVCGTTVVDRRRSFSRRRNPSRSPARPCTIDVSEQSLRPLMIGDICEDYDGLNLRQGDLSTVRVNSNAKEIEAITTTTLKRSTSDVDAHPMNKQMTIRKKSQNLDTPQFLEYEMRPGGMCFFWNTVAAQRMSSRNHRCETRWTCGLYAEAGGKNDPSSPNASNNVTFLSRRHTEHASNDRPRLTGVRLRPTAIYLEDKSCLMFPNFQKVIPASEVPLGICRRISSIYEQKKGTNETGLKNWTLRGSLVSPDHLNSTNGGGTHLSRRSSHASTGSSTSTILGPN
ncbi:Rho GTPase-activating protein 20 [Taenia crassiceps]|uniref:Rho GTPase-activating protein 20 n=1 Tax=Taenia crassiceps TaxID=6207 RepID=A0ABR4QC48_9CEST